MHKPQRTDAMPLIKSKTKKARQENIKREIAAGKDPKQAVAIGYAVQRRAAGDGERSEGPSRYDIEDGLRTAQRHTENMADKKLVKGMVKHAAAQHALMQQVKSGAVSQRQADRAKGAAK